MNKKNEKKKVLKIKCAHCKTQFNYYDSEFRPFCTERCKMIDMGHWLNESYVVARGLQEDEVDEYVEAVEKKNNES